MKKINFLFAFMMLLSVSFSYAQESEDAVTEDELTKYVDVMVYAELEKATMAERYNAWIQESELMQGGRRFQEIKAAADDEGKMAELAITEEELAAFNEIQAKYDEMVTEFKSAYTEKIKDKEILGAATYNKVKRALKTDSELKTQFKEMLEAGLEDADDVAEEMNEDAGEDQGDTK